MRRLGDIKDEKLAHRFDAYLAKLGIDAEVRSDDAGGWDLWVLDEDRLDQADAALQGFLAKPSDSAFDAPPRAKPAPPTPATAPRSSRAAGRDAWPRTQGAGGIFATLPVTMYVIAACTLLTALTSVPSLAGLHGWLSYSNYMSRGFPEIMDGQVWRLVTPALLHGSVFHLLFNMIWLYQLGGLIEQIERSRYLALILVAAAVCVNTAQYLVSGPAFVGASGVVYALLGYVWIMARYQPGTQYFVSDQTVIIMVIWMVICLVGIIANVANTQHVAGFVLGLAWGYIRSGHLPAARRRRRFRSKL